MSRRHRTAPAGCACCSTTASTRPTRRETARTARCSTGMPRAAARSMPIPTTTSVPRCRPSSPRALRRLTSSRTTPRRASPRPRSNLQPSPVSLVADSANPSAEDPADLFERIRRYAAVSIWDTLDMTQPAVRDQVSTTPLLGYLLQELPRLTDNLGNSGRLPGAPERAGECMAARLPCPGAAAQPAEGRRGRLAGGRHLCRPPDPLRQIQPGCQAAEQRLRAERLLAAPGGDGRLAAGRRGAVAGGRQHGGERGPQPTESSAKAVNWPAPSSWSA